VSPCLRGAIAMCRIKRKPDGDGTLAPAKGRVKRKPWALGSGCAAFCRRRRSLTLPAAGWRGGQSCFLAVASSRSVTSARWLGGALTRLPGKRKLPASAPPCHHGGSMGSARDSVPDPSSDRSVAHALKPACLPPLPSTGLTLATSPAPGEDSLVDRCNCSTHILVPACVCPPRCIARPPGSLRDQDDSLQHDSTRMRRGRDSLTRRQNRGIRLKQPTHCSAPISGK
jgi:hypothetical protein